jgi:hypothetical protein
MVGFSPLFVCFVYFVVHLHRPHHGGGRTGLPFQRVHSGSGPRDLNFLFFIRVARFYCWENQTK